MTNLQSRKLRLNDQHISVVLHYMYAEGELYSLLEFGFENI